MRTRDHIAARALRLHSDAQPLVVLDGAIRVLIVLVYSQRHAVVLVCTQLALVDGPGLEILILSRGCTDDHSGGRLVGGGADGGVQQVPV